ncbi:MAG: hypothetical protein JNJ54_28920 [Myxococcaceae bacterium]|nr:hypothetical protein [Myxococcaceae bacterium]
MTPVQWAWIVALLCGVAPLFASRALPLVDLPQHLHLISVLHRLDDASTLFPEVFERRVQLTPYLGYYYLVSWLNWLLPLELANRLFLAAYVAGLPLSLAFLLKSLRRPTWPALLALPFAYGDSFAWGFLNYCTALPLAFLTCGLFVHAIEAEPAKRRPWVIGLAIALVAVLLFHVQVFAWLGVALPFLLLTTPAPEGRTWKARVPAVLGVAPGVLLFIAWVGLRVGEPAEIAPGQPWKSWGPMLSEQNLGWKSFEQNRAEFLPTLANMLPDGADQLAVKVTFALALLGVVLALTTGRDTKEGLLARWRIVGLALLGVTLYFALPFDIRGYMYYLNTRYAHLAAALLVVCMPPLKKEWTERMVWAGVIVGALTAWPLWRAFKDFDAESAALTDLARDAGDKPRTMGLVFGPGSRVVTHPVYLHASTVIARERGGLTNFSFALTPHSPLKYRGEPPPTFPSEWDPRPWAQYASSYDHFVVRGVHPSQLFGGRLDGEFFIAGQRGDFFLVRRR